MTRGIRTQLKKGRIAQLVEQRTGITWADMGFNPNGFQSTWVSIYFSGEKKKIIAAHYKDHLKGHGHAILVHFKNQKYVLTSINAQK